MLYSCKKDNEKTTTVSSHTLSFSITSLNENQSAAGDTASFNIIYSNGKGEHINTSAYGVTKWESDTMALNPTLYTVFLTANVVYPFESATGSVTVLNVLVDGEVVRTSILPLSSATAVTIEARVNN